MITLTGDIGLLNQALEGLQFVPDTDYFGPASLLVVSEDNGEFTILGDANARDVDMIPIQVAPLNDLPTFDLIPDQTIDEDTIALNVAITGISAGPMLPPNETEQVRFTATSSDTSKIPDPVINYSFFDTTGSLDFAPVAEEFGTVTITVTIEDAGLDNDFGTTADNQTFTQTFDIILTAVNDAPTLDAIPNQPLTVDEDESNVALRTVNLTGITAGPGGESEPVRLSATSSDTGIVLTPTISYVSPNTTATLTYDLVGDAFGGPTTITVTVEDAGLDGVFDDDAATPLIDESLDNLSFVRTILVTVDAIPDPPTINPIADESHLEDGGAKTVALSGISNGPPNEIEEIAVTASSSDPGIVPDPTVSYTDPSTTGTLVYDPVPDAFGTVTITVRVEAGGADGLLSTTADNEVTLETFDVTIIEDNDLPTIDPILDESHPEDGGAKMVPLSGITTGALNESEPLAVTATSSDPSIVPHPVVTYTNPSATGMLVYQPLADQFGTVTITVRVEDGGLDGLLVTTGDNGVTLETFDVTITEDNDLPEINAIGDQTIDEDTGPGFIALSGINNGAANEDDAISVTATSSDTLIVMNPVVTYSSGDTNGTLRYDLVPDGFGTATITLLVRDAGVDNVLGSGDDGMTTTMFDIVVNPVNDAPKLDAIPNQPLTVDEDESDVALRTINLTGISNGAANETEDVRISVVSDSPAIISSVSLPYTSPDSTAQLSYTLVPNAFGGPVSFTVTIQDAGFDGVFDDDPLTPLVNESTDNRSTIQVIQLVVDPVNDPPTLNPIPAQIVEQDSGPQTIALSGITSGMINESQVLQITATSGDPTLVSDLLVSYVSPGTMGTLTYTPQPGQSGATTVTVTVDDGGANGMFSQVIQVTVDPPDPPVPMDDLLFTDEDKFLRIPSSALLANDEDPDIRPTSPEFLTVLLPPTSMSTLGATVNFNSATGEITYDPSTSEDLQKMKPGDTLQDSFIYAITDADGEATPPTATVFLDVTGINDAPIVRDDTVPAPTTSNPIVITPLNNDVDIDGTLDLNSLIITVDPKFGSLAKRINSAGVLELAYSPFTDFPGSDSFRYTISDNLGLFGRQATVTIAASNAPQNRQRHWRWRQRRHHQYRRACQ